MAQSSANYGLAALRLPSGVRVQASVAGGHLLKQDVLGTQLSVRVGIRAGPLEDIYS